MVDKLCEVLPYFKELTKQRKQVILENFEQIKYPDNQDTVVENEGELCSYLYLVYKGGFLLYKKLGILYEQKQIDEEMTKELVNLSGVRPLELFHHPKDGPTADIGICVGAVQGKDAIVGEDAGLFKQKLNYTLVAKKGTIAFRYPVKYALQGWHIEALKQLRNQVLSKYEWLYFRFSRLERQLLQPSQNVSTLKAARKIEERTELDFPVANKVAKETLKSQKMKDLNMSDFRYLGKATRINEDFKTQRLTGYLDKQDTLRIQR